MSVNTRQVQHNRLIYRLHTTSHRPQGAQKPQEPFRKKGGALEAFRDCLQSGWLEIFSIKGRKQMAAISAVNLEKNFSDLYFPVDGGAGGDSLRAVGELRCPPSPSSSLKVTGASFKFEIFSNWNILTINFCGYLISTHLRLNLGFLTQSRLEGRPTR